MKNNPFLLGLAMVALLHIAHADMIITPNAPTLSVAVNPDYTPNSGAARANPNAGSSLAALVNGISLSAPVPTGMSTAAALAVTQSLDGPTVSYVTNTSDLNGDYFATGGPLPVLTFTLGGSYNNVNSIVVWNYAMSVDNSTQTFSLDFYSDATATNAIGSTISGLSLATAQNPEVAQQVFFGGGGTLMFDNVQAIKMTLTDNFGGNRVGLGEVRFSAIPEPSSLALILSAFGILYLRRRRLQ